MRHTVRVKARRPMVCECCKVNITTGSQIVMFHGRPWLPACVVRYRAKRRVSFKGE